MEALFHSLAVQVAVAAAIFPAIVKVFSTVEDSLSEEAKEKIGSLINRLDEVNVPNAIAPKISLIFDAVFGPRHFSLVCAYRVTVIAVISYVLVSLSVLTFAPQQYAHPEALKTLAVCLLLVNLPAEYFGLWMTRYMVKQQESPYRYVGQTWLEAKAPWLKKMQTTERWLEDHLPLRYFLRFFLDCYTKYILTALLFAYFVSNQELRSIFTDYEQILSVSYRDPGMVVPLVSLFLSALWIWVYVFIRLNLRAAYTAARMLKWGLDVKKHPVKSIGVITAEFAVLTCRILYLSHSVLARM